MEKNLVSVLKPNNEDSNLTIESFDERVYLVNGAYEDIFGIKYKDQDYLPSKRGIIKVQEKGTKRKIYRLFAGGNRVDSLQIGLSRSSMQILGLDDNQNYDFILSKGYKFQFMWNHPNHSTRIAYRISLWAIFIGILSIFFAGYSVFSIG